MATCQTSQDARPPYRSRVVRGWLSPLGRLFFRSAYLCMRVYWHVCNPETRGALVAVWHDGAMLLIKNSYVSYRSLPGGYVKEGESPEQAAVRELAEEVGIEVSSDRLSLATHQQLSWEGKRDNVWIFSLTLNSPPEIIVDGWEVESACFLAPEAALQHKLFPPVRSLLRSNLGNSASAS